MRALQRVYQAEMGLAENSKKGILFTGTFLKPYSMLSPATNLNSTPKLALPIAITIGLVTAAPKVKSFSKKMLLQRRKAEAGHSRMAHSGQNIFTCGAHGAKLLALFDTIILVVVAGNRLGGNIPSQSALFLLHLLTHQHYQQHAQPARERPLICDHGRSNRRDPVWSGTTIDQSEGIAL